MHVRMAIIHLDLKEEDHLSIVDKMAGPNMSFILLLLYIPLSVTKELLCRLIVILPWLFQIVPSSTALMSLRRVWLLTRTHSLRRDSRERLLGLTLTSDPGGRGGWWWVE